MTNNFRRKFLIGVKSLESLKSINNYNNLNRGIQKKMLDVLRKYKILQEKYKIFLSKNKCKYFTFKGIKLKTDDENSMILFLYEYIFNDLDIKSNLILPEKINSVYYIRTDEKLHSSNNIEPTIIPTVYKVTGKLSGQYLIQNFSSCLPAYILNPSLNSTVIDGCAAPGNKTDHLNSILKGTGQIYAIEKDKSRFEILRKRVPKNIKCINDDFLNINIQADYILLDPPCSGSGTKEYTTENELKTLIEKSDKFIEEEPDLKSIQELQIKLLEHAIFLKPKYIVYSTCSYYEAENEEVVKKILIKFPNVSLENININWDRRGNKKYPFYEKVIRVDKSQSLTGFFVALFKLK